MNLNRNLWLNVYTVLITDLEMLNIGMNFVIKIWYKMKGCMEKGPTVFIRLNTPLELTPH